MVRRSLVVLVMPHLIVAGVLSGGFTWTEAAAGASIDALVICLLFACTMTLGDLPAVRFDTGRTSSIVFLLLATRSGLSHILAKQGVPRLIADGFGALTDNRPVFLLLLNIAPQPIGIVHDLFPAIIIFGPIFASISRSSGIDPVHFGVIIHVNLRLGLNTPPAGSGQFIGAAVGKARL